MFEAIVNQEKKIAIEYKEGDLFLEQNLVDWDFVQVDDNKYHVVKSNRSYTIEVVKVDLQSKLMIFRINDTNYEVALKDNTDLLLAKLGFKNLTKDATAEIKAPMPGLILEILVAEGTEIKKGDPVLILEAMKMENVLKSPRDGTVKSILATKGKSVEKNQILVKF